MRIYSAEALLTLWKGTGITTGAIAIYCDPPVFAWGGPGNRDIDGDTYLGFDDRGIAQVTNGAIGGTEQNVSITLSGIEPRLLPLLDGAGLNGAPVKLYKMLFDGTGTRLLDVRVFKRGRLDGGPQIEDVIGDKATITLSIETAARGLGRQTNRVRSDADQRLVDPDDGFCKHISYAGVKTIYLNGSKPSSAGSALGG